MGIISPSGGYLRKISAALLLAGTAALFSAPAGAQTVAPDTASPASPLYLTLTNRPAAPDTPVDGVRLTGEPNAGFYLGGVVGYAFTDNLRAEIEAFYRNDRIGEPSGGRPAPDMTFTPSRPAPGIASAYGGMARGRWEFGRDSAFAPYIGGGVGLATVDFDITLDNAKDRDEASLFAYEFTAGARYTLTPRSSIRAGYRLSGTSDTDRDTARPDERTHAIEFGINYRF